MTPAGAFPPGLRDTVAGIAARGGGCAAAVRAMLARCSALEPQVQAWEHLDAARALDRAEAADARLRAGRPARLLEGTTLGIKDIIDVAGMPTRMGSPLTAPDAAAADAQCVERLQAAGGIVLGKTVTTEFAYYAPGRTRNPWHPGHTPGGSSSGSAAAVACGMVAGALGTQTNGSIIRPAAFCGIVGYKPTIGAVSSHGTLDPWPSLDHTGVLARTVADAALLAHVITAGTVPAAPAPLVRPRLLALRTPVWSQAEDHARTHFEETLARLRAAGAELVERELPDTFAAAWPALRTLMAREAYAHFGALRRARGEALSVQLRELVDAGGGVSDAAYREARDVQRALRERYAGCIGDCDAVLSLPTPGEAPATLTHTGSPVFCSLWSLLGVPAITVPAGRGPRGLPLGLQLTSAREAEARVLDAAAWCEAILGFQTYDRWETR